MAALLKSQVRMDSYYSTIENEWVGMAALLNEFKALLVLLYQLR